MNDTTKTKNGKLNTECRMPRSLVICGILALTFISLTPVSGFAANFSVSPSFLELSNGVKSGVFSVINGGEEKLNCQIDVKEWGQDADGKDVYTDAKDIVFFPKIMTVGPNEQRAIRIGVKGPPSMKERTYRIFVEEIPSQKKEQQGKTSEKITAGLTIAFRYAMPIFVKPVKQQESAIIEKTGLSKGVARAAVRNTGNIHIKLQSVTFRGKAADGKTLFSQDSAGWYVLHGLTRTYEATVPKEVCKDLATIEVTAASENISANGTLNVQKNMCGQ